MKYTTTTLAGVPCYLVPCAELDALRKDAELLLMLKSEIADRLYSYERFGATCTFEGSPMVHADILEELAAIAGEKNHG